MNRKLRFLLTALILLGAAAAMFVAAARWSAESDNRNVELVADWRQIQQMAALSNVPLDGLLRELHQHGILGVAVSEDTIAGLRDDGALVVEVESTPDGGSRTLVSSYDENLLNRVRAYLLPKLNLKELLIATRTRQGYPAFVWPGSFEQIRAINVGLPPQEVKRLQDAGFDVVGRIVNYQSANPSNIEWTLDNLKQLRIQKVIFGGEEVLGYRDMVKETAGLLRKKGLEYGSVEFSKQRGDELLTLALQGDYLRVHSITPAEITKLQPAEMVERYVRAGEERNIRVAFVRFLPFVTAKGWDDQFEFLDQIRSGLRKSGLTVGLAGKYRDPLSRPALARPLRAVIGVGTAAAAVYLLALLLPLGEGLMFLLLSALSVVHIGLLVGTQELGRKLVSLEAAILFPTLAMVGLYGFLRYRLREERSFEAVGVFLLTSLVSLLGALYVVGLLSSREYMLKSQQFVGIKAAHLLPLVILAVVFSLDFVTDQRTRERMWDDARQRVSGVLSRPILIWQMIAMFVGLAALAMLVLRTGNDPGVAVSPMEMRFRSLLDHFLYVRPRTKEFLIGHPLLVATLVWAAAQIRMKKGSAPRWQLNRGVLVLLLLVGAIGQVSMVNTFCHIHTPLKVSVWRIGNGIWTGALLGFILYWILPKQRAKVGETASRGVPVESGRA